MPETVPIWTFLLTLACCVVLTVCNVLLTRLVRRSSKQLDENTVLLQGASAALKEADRVALAAAFWRWRFMMAIAGIWVERRLTFRDD